MKVGLISERLPPSPRSLFAPDQSTALPAGLSLSVEVADVDADHAKAEAVGVEIVYPLTDEPWGVRRFYVADPNEVVVNVMNHVRGEV